MFNMCCIEKVLTVSTMITEYFCSKCFVMMSDKFLKKCEGSRISTSFFFNSSNCINIFTVR